MKQSWHERLKWWICGIIGHPFPKKGWFYNGHYHRDCRICGRIISDSIRARGQE